MTNIHEGELALDRIDCEIINAAVVFTAPDGRKHLTSNGAEHVLQDQGSRELAPRFCPLLTDAQRTVASFVLCGGCNNSDILLTVK